MQMSVSTDSLFAIMLCEKKWPTVVDRCVRDLKILESKLLNESFVSIRLVGRYDGPLAYQCPYIESSR